MELINLKTEYLINPLGIDVVHPHLTWNVIGDDIQRQKAFEITYKKNDEKEKIIIKESSSSHYEFEEELKSRDFVIWKLKVRNEKGAWSNYSKESHFSIGLLNKTDWAAKWIYGDYSVSKKKRYPVDYFKKEFVIENLSKAYFHSNNKTDFDITYGIENGIGYFVADNIEEINVIERECAKLNKTQKVLLRLTPGIDTHTYEADQTGKIDSKFGTAIETGQALSLVGEILKLPHISLMGFHCHVGSQVFEEDVYLRTSKIMLKFFADVKEKYGFETLEYDIGGGFGVRYVSTDPVLHLDTKLKELSEYINEECKRLSINVPAFRMEPGRSIVADAGMTLYTVGTIKKIPGYKNYVSIDGGMTDNPRFALYGANYTCMVANKMNEALDFKADLVGRCCESGDIIQKDIMFPSSVKRYDTVAVATTGAYNYSMASNYNRLPRPAVVMLKDDKDFIVVKAETFENIILNDI